MNSKVLALFVSINTMLLHAQDTEHLLSLDARIQGVISPYESVDVNRTDDILSGLSLRRFGVIWNYKADRWTIGASGYVRSETAARDYSIYYDSDRRKQIKNDEFVIRKSDLFAAYNVSQTSVKVGYFRSPLYGEKIWKTRAQRNLAILNLTDRRWALEGKFSITKSMVYRLNVGTLPRFVKDRERDSEGLKSRFFNNVGTLPNSLHTTLEYSKPTHSWRLGGFVHRIGNRLTFNPPMNEKGYLVGFFSDLSEILISTPRDTVTISSAAVYGGVSGQDLKNLINKDNRFFFCSLSAEYLRELQKKRLGLTGLGLTLGFSYSAPDLRRFEDYWDAEANRNIDDNRVADGILSSNFHFNSSAKVTLSYEVTLFSMTQQVHVARLQLSFQLDKTL